MSHRDHATRRLSPRARACLAAVTLAVVLAAISGASLAPSAARADPSFRTHDLVLVVERDGQHWIVQVDMLLFDDGRGDFAAAEAAAGAAMLARFPGATVITDAPGSVTAQYVLNPYRWTTPGATWRYNSAGKPTSLSGDEKALRAAAATWHDAGVNFSLDYGGTTTDNTAGCNNQTDGRNTVGWAAQTGNTLAVTCTWYSGAQKASEFDMQIDPGWSWTTSDSGIQVDLQSVTTHEFGHALGLAHSNVSGSVMWASYANGSNKRTLTADDIEGAKSIYGSAPPPASSTSLPINPGANLVTWPGADLAPEKAFATAANVVVVIYAYDAGSKSWTRFAPGAPAYVNNLSLLRRGGAYWVVATGAAVITVDP